MIKIGIDASGGDNGEIEVIKASVNVISQNKDLDVVLYGDRDIIGFLFKKNNLEMNDRISIVDAKEKISMNDHPVFALRDKPNSSIFMAGQDIINNKIAAFISAGNTGALVALCQLYIRAIDNVLRPVVAAIVPTYKKPLLIIDSGCNMDSKPEWLYQYAILGKVYLEEMFGIKEPRVGLLSVGTEENKGNTLTLAAYRLIKANKDINFIGNVEARDVPFGICDVLVCDGFAGNVLLKTYEGTAKMLLGAMKESLTQNILSTIGALFIKGTLKKTMAKYDAKIYGGAPILGANGLVVKCHGNAKAFEYQQAFEQVYSFVNKNIIEKMKKAELNIV